jgi:hypothetical protein
MLFVVGQAARQVIGVLQGLDHQAAGRPRASSWIRDQEVFRLLVLASQDANIRLTDVAEHLAGTGRLATRCS